MKKILTAVLTGVTIIIGLAACAQGGGVAAPASATAVAYGRVHGAGSLGRVQITANKDGAVSAAEIDETFFPVTNGWTQYGAGVYGADGFENYYTYGAEESPITTAYAKYIKVGDKTFEATGTAATPVYKETGGNVYDLEKLLQSGDFEICEWYYKAVTTGKAQILKKYGDTLAKDVDAKHSSVTFNKKSASSAYWAASDNAIGWKGNIAELEDYIRNNGVNYGYDSFSRAEDGNYWVIGDTATGATLTDMGDYMLLAKKAYNLAQAQYAAFK
ncbi:MAG: hypothetical protein LBS99_04425 [Clostridiales bacterium]|jgi:hypothetical protein|nr:hypothetical protein [Clostridiales bacterium]